MNDNKALEIIDKIFMNIFLVVTRIPLYLILLILNQKPKKY